MTDKPGKKPENKPPSGSAESFDLDYGERLLSGEDPHIERLAIRYILNLIESTDRKSATAYRICAAAERMLATYEGQLDFPVNKQDKKIFYKDLRYAPRGAVVEQDWQKLKEFFEKRYDEIPDSKPQAIYENLMKLADYLELTETEKNTLSLIYTMNGSMDLQVLMNVFLKEDKEKLPAAFSRMNKEPSKIREYYKALDFNAPLSSFGLIVDGEFTEDHFFPDIDPMLREPLSRPGMDVTQIVSSVLGNPVEAELGLNDFDHVGSELAFTARLIKQAVDRKEKGINILFHGDPGGGKTALAAALAKELGFRMYAVGEDEDVNIGAQRTSQKRLSQLLRTQALLKGSDKTILLFDEIEDLLIKGTDTQKKADTDSKILLNRLLENNEVVTIWAGNDPDKFHEAVRQRFTYSLHMGYPPTLIRKKIWQRRLDMQKLALADDDVLELAREYSAPPRMIAKAVRSAAITDQSLKTIRRSLESDARITLGHREAILSASRVPAKFDKALLNLNGATHAQVEKLIDNGRLKTPFSLALTGPSGSGVSSLLRYMSEGMVLNPLETSMASLIQPTPFSTPAQNIMGAFREAANERAFLIIHDIETLVENPKAAGDQWVKGLAGVFRKAAAKHSLPFAVSSKTGIELPEIFLHNFSHRLKLDSLNVTQARKAYKLYFNKRAPKALDELKSLVPGDFARVASLLTKQFDVNPDAKTILDRLEEQKSFRAIDKKSKIGLV
jgi:MoxR-like ATPase